MFPQQQLNEYITGFNGCRCIHVLSTDSSQPLYELTLHQMAILNEDKQYGMVQLLQHWRSF